jgi:hypothetical protein
VRFSAYSEDLWMRLRPEGETAVPPQFPQDMASLIAETVDLPPLATDARFSQPSTRTISRSCSHLLRPHLSYERPGDVLFLSTNLQKGSETCGRVRELLREVLCRTGLLGETQKNLS